MLHDTILAALVPLMAFIHRLRGGGYVTLPIKGTYVLWPIVGLLAYAAGASWQASIAWAIGYLIWILPGWMEEITAATGAAVPAGQVMGAGPDVRLITLASFGQPELAVILRAAVYLVPLVVALPLLGEPSRALALVVALFLPAYLIGNRVRPDDMSSVAEPIVGASWGAAMALTMMGV